MIVAIFKFKTVTYYGLKDIYGATNYDSISIHAHANVHTLLGYTHRETLANKVQVPLCDNSYKADQYNQNGNCPADGSYSFATAFQTESPSEIGGWLLTGYKGEIVLNMYLDSTKELVGRCRVDMKTKPTNWQAPSGKLVSCLVLASLIGGVAYALIKCRCPKWLAKTKTRAKKTLWGGYEDSNAFLEKGQSAADYALTKDQWIMI